MDFTDLFAPPPPPPPAPAPVVRPKTKLSVQNIDVDVEYQPNGANLMAGDEHVEHVSPTIPSDAIKAWIADEFTAVGGDYTARFSIIEASIIKRPFQTKANTFLGVTTERNPGYRYEITLDVVLEILDPRGYIVQNANSIVRNVKNVKGTQSPAQERAIYAELTDKTMLELRAEMSAAIRKYLGLFVVRG